MRGVSSLEELCRAAAAQSATHFALTDTNGLYGAVRFVETARQHGLKPILGAELVHGAHRAVCLAKDAEGYANLCRILSERHCDKNFAAVGAVARRRRGLVVLSDDLAAVKAWSEQSRGDLYVELAPGPQMNDAVKFSRALKLPPVATNQVHFVKAEDYPLHRLLRAIDLNTTLSRVPDGACCAPESWLMPPPRLARGFVHVPEALANAAAIVDACRTDWDFKETIFPAFRALSDAEAFALLQEKTYAGARRRYGGLPDEVRERIESELAIIRDKSFSHYFLIVDEIVGRRMTCGRGSAAASIVSYALGITDVDPVRHRLQFERFLTRTRNDPPDIDVDFPWDERDDVLAWVFETYGGKGAALAKIAMVGNQNTLALRGALREVAKVYGIAPGEIDQNASVILKRLNFLRMAESPEGESWAESLCELREFAAPWPEILDRAFRVVGHFRNLGLHCGGIVVVPDEIRKYVPVEISAKKIPVLQWEKDQVEDAGLVKIDLLGNRSLAVVRDALAAIKANAGIALDYHTWNPVDDAKTQDAICRGETIGCFYIESPATRLLLKKLWTKMPEHLKDKADVFEYLVAVSSLVRPASIAFVNDFVRRAHGAPYDPLHPLLEKALAETHGIMVYQEDVANVAVALADFTPTEGEHLRKILNKKHKQLQLKDYRERFFRRAIEKEVAPATVERVWKMIMSFAGYSFCKPHSASYARLSFKCAYLKTHHPAEFMAAVISNEGGFYPTFAYVSEARRMGIEFLPPDINEGAWAYTPAGKDIRVGFMQIKGLERAWIDKVVAERNAAGPFRSLSDFQARARPGLAALRLLIKAGCFDSIAGGLTRPALLWRAHALAAGKEGDDLPAPRDFSEKQKLKHEIELFGFPLRRRALELYASPRLAACVPARDLARHAGKSIAMAGILVSEKMTQTKKGDLMEFVTFEDLTGIYETTFFPGAYRKYYQLLEGGRPFLLHGRVEEEFGTFTLNVARVERLDMRRGAAILEVDSPEWPHGSTAAETRSLGGRLPAAGQNPPRA